MAAVVERDVAGPARALEPGESGCASIVPTMLVSGSRGRSARRGCCCRRHRAQSPSPSPPSSVGSPRSNIVPSLLLPSPRSRPSRRPRPRRWTRRASRPSVSTSRRWTRPIHHRRRRRSRARGGSKTRRVGAVDMPGSLLTARAGRGTARRRTRTRRGWSPRRARTRRRRSDAARRGRPAWPLARVGARRARG